MKPSKGKIEPSKLKQAEAVAAGERRYSFLYYLQDGALASLK